VLRMKSSQSGSTGRNGVEDARKLGASHVSAIPTAKVWKSRQKKRRPGARPGWLIEFEARSLLRPGGSWPSRSEAAIERTALEPAIGWVQDTAKGRQAAVGSGGIPVGGAGGQRFTGEGTQAVTLCRWWCSSNKHFATDALARSDSPSEVMLVSKFRASIASSARVDRRSASGPPPAIVDGGQGIYFGTGRRRSAS